MTEGPPARPGPPTRLRLATHPRAVELLRRRARGLAALRAQLDGDGFLEADVPPLLPHAGQEPWLEAPVAAVSGLPGPLHLQTSPELALKRLLCAGAERLYHLGPAFRGGREELGPLHQPAFTMLEWYEPGTALDLLAQRCRALGRAAAEALGVAPPADGEVLDLDTAFRRWAGVSLAPLLDGDRARFVAEGRAAGLGLRDDDPVANLVGRVLVERVEPALAGVEGWVFLHGYPAELAALARLDPADPRVALRMEAYLGGVELANGYVELGDADEQTRRWDAEAAGRSGPAPPRDEGLLEALRTEGLPDCVGMALGIDRLFAALLGVAGLDEVLPLALRLED